MLRGMFSKICSGFMILLLVVFLPLRYLPLPGLTFLCDLVINKVVFRYFDKDQYYSQLVCGLGNRTERRASATAALRYWISKMILDTGLPSEADLSEMSKMQQRKAIMAAYRSNGHISLNKREACNLLGVSAGTNENTRRHKLMDRFDEIDKDKTSMFDEATKMDVFLDVLALLRLQQDAKDDMVLVKSVFAEIEEIQDSRIKITKFMKKHQKGNVLSFPIEFLQKSKAFSEDWQFGQTLEITDSSTADRIAMELFLQEQKEEEEKKKKKSKKKRSSPRLSEDNNKPSTSSSGGANKENNGNKVVKPSEVPTSAADLRKLIKKEEARLQKLAEDRDLINYVDLSEVTREVRESGKTFDEVMNSKLIRDELPENGKRYIKFVKPGTGSRNPNKGSASNSKISSASNSTKSSASNSTKSSATNSTKSSATNSKLSSASNSNNSSGSNSMHFLTSDSSGPKKKNGKEKKFVTEIKFDSDMPPLEIDDNGEIDYTAQIAALLTKTAKATEEKEEREKAERERRAKEEEQKKNEVPTAGDKKLTKKGRKKKGADQLEAEKRREEYRKMLDREERLQKEREDEEKFRRVEDLLNMKDVEAFASNGKVSTSKSNADSLNKAMKEKLIKEKIQRDAANARKNKVKKTVKKETKVVEIESSSIGQYALKYEPNSSDDEEEDITHPSKKLKSTDKSGKDILKMLGINPDNPMSDDMDDNDNNPKIIDSNTKEYLIQEIEQSALKGTNADGKLPTTSASEVKAELDKRLNNISEEKTVTSTDNKITEIIENSNEQKTKIPDTSTKAEKEISNTTSKVVAPSLQVEEQRSNVVERKAVAEGSMLSQWVEKGVPDSTEDFVDFIKHVQAPKPKVITTNESEVIKSIEVHIISKEKSNNVKEIVLGASQERTGSKSKTINIAKASGVQNSKPLDLQEVPNAKVLETSNTKGKNQKQSLLATEPKLNAIKSKTEEKKSEDKLNELPNSEPERLEEPGIKSAEPLKQNPNLKAAGNEIPKECELENKDSEEKKVQESKPSLVQESKPSLAQQPKPSPNQQSKPSSTEQPKPSTVQQPKPSSTEQPKPSTVQQPKPSSTEQSKPSTVQQPKPSSTEQPKPKSDNPLEEMRTVRGWIDLILEMGGSVGLVQADGSVRIQKQKLDDDIVRQLDQQKKEKEAKRAVIAAKVEAARAEASRREKEKLEKERLEKERIEKDKLEKEKLKREKLEKEKLEKEKLEKEKLEKEKLEKEKLEKEKLEKEKLEKEKLDKEKLEKERLKKEAAKRTAVAARADTAKRQKEKLEKERLEKERLEKERQENERLEKERLEKEKLEKERLEKERFEKEQLEKERLEKERLEKERLEKERLEKERLEKERLEKERLEKERLEKERLKKERLEKERLKKERLEKERLEKERHEKERLEKERLEKERFKKERLEKERLEKERLEKERLEKERLEKERLEKERLEKERLEKERLEKERLEKERLEKERLEKERLEKERLEKERLEKERLEKERLEKERLEKEHLEKERIEKERDEAARTGAGKIKTSKSVVDSQEKKRRLHAKVFFLEGATANKAGEYDKAITNFTQAIGLWSTNYRLYCGRSLSYERKMNYKKALEDAETCLTLKPGEKKGLFRKGKALMGLKDYSTADKIFREVLKIDENYSDATEEIINGRLLRLMEMGFDMAKSQKILDKSKITDDFEVVVNEILGPKEIDEPAKNPVMTFSPTKAPPKQLAEVNPELPPQEDLPTQTNGFTETPAATKLAEKTSNSTCENEIKVEIATNQNQVEIHTQNQKITSNDFQYDLNGRPINGDSNGFPEIKAPTSMWSNPVSGPRRVPVLSPSKPPQKIQPPQKSHQQRQHKRQQQQPPRMQQLRQTNQQPVDNRTLPKYDKECFYWLTSGCWKSEEECQFLHIPQRRGVDRQKQGLKRPKFAGYK